MCGFLHDQNGRLRFAEPQFQISICGKWLCSSRILARLPMSGSVRFLQISLPISDCLYIHGSVDPLPHRALHTHKYLQCDEFSLLRPFSSAISIRAYTKHMTAGIVEVNSGRWWFCESFKVNSSQSTSAFRSEGKFARHHKTRTKVHHRLFFRKGCIFCGAAASV